ncbi:AMP-binding protein [Streptomyces sp. 769]|uniref:AMP-binding protein n=1 Tax=Streptomyces sp. 769 TaxID=1262452 RepID=UPI0023B02759|nr:AMP-binding protein [Streptomyces sp. 769]
MPTYLAAVPFTDLPHLRRIVLGGEALHLGPLEQWIGRYDVANAYGPTETCVEALVAEHLSPGEDPVPIGRPLPGVRAWVLDAHQQPVPAGEAGELYLGGQGLTTGYLDRPEETAEAFLLLRLPGPDGQERVYRTGDRVQQRPDGQYMFLGRVDSQLNLGGVRAAALLTDQAASGRPRLVLHVETDDTGLPARLHKQLANQLPPSAVPALITARPSLPSTSTGKIDRLALSHTACELTAPDTGATGPDPQRSASCSISEPSRRDADR